MIKVSASSVIFMQYRNSNICKNNLQSIKAKQVIKRVSNLTCFVFSTLWSGWPNAVSDQNQHLIEIFTIRWSHYFKPTSGSSLLKVWSTTCENHPQHPQKSRRIDQHYATQLYNVGTSLFQHALYNSFCSKSSCVCMCDLLHRALALDEVKCTLLGPFGKRSF